MIWSLIVGSSLSVVLILQLVHQCCVVRSVHSLRRFQVWKFSRRQRSTGRLALHDLPASLAVVKWSHPAYPTSSGHARTHTQNRQTTVHTLSAARNDSLLLVNWLQISTQFKCAHCLEQVRERWCVADVPPCGQHELVPLSLKDSLETLFETGTDTSEASSLSRGVLRVCPELAHPQRVALHWASVVLRGWDKLELGLTRPRPPNAAAMATVLRLTENGHHHAALLIWMLFETHLRVIQILSMRSEDIVGSSPHIVTVMACSSALRRL